MEDDDNQRLPLQLDVGRIEEGAVEGIMSSLYDQDRDEPYMQLLRAWTNLKMPKAEAERSTQTPLRMDVT